MIGDLTFNHPCMARSNTWRDLKPEHRKLTPMRGLRNVIPLATDGVIFYGLTPEGGEFVGHLNNLDTEVVKVICFVRPKKEKVEQRPRKQKTAKQSSDISDWL